MWKIEDSILQDGINGFDELEPKDIRNRLRQWETSLSGKVKKQGYAGHYLDVLDTVTLYAGEVLSIFNRFKMGSVNDHHLRMGRICKDFGRHRNSFINWYRSEEFKDANPGKFVRYLESQLYVFFEGIGIDFRGTPIGKQFDDYFNLRPFSEYTIRDLTHIPEQPVTRDYGEVSDVVEVFVNEEIKQRAIRALSLVVPPVIDDNNNYLLGPKKKSVFVAWRDVLTRKGMIKGVTDAEMTTYLNNEIQGLDLYLDGRTLRSHTKIAEKYFPEFEKAFE